MIFEQKRSNEDDQSYWESRFHVERELYMHAGLTGAAALAVLIAWIIILFRGHVRKDPARVAFTWLKVALFFYFLGLIIQIPLDVLEADRVWLDTNAPREFRSRERLNALRDAESTRLNLGTASQFFRRLADCLVVITLIELGNGFMFALKRTRTKSQKVLRWLAIFVATALFAIGLTQLAQFNILFRQVWEVSGEFEPEGNDYNSEPASGLFTNIMVNARLSHAYYILNFITGLPILVYASAIMHKFTIIEPCRGCAVLYLTAAIANLTRLTWNLAWVIITITAGFPNWSYEVSQLLDIFLDVWMVAVFLILVSCIAMKKKKGIWTTRQLWMSGDAPFLTRKGRSIEGQTKEAA